MLSVIVPVYAMQLRIADLWQDNLATLHRVSGMDTEVIVIDNGSAYPPAYATVTWAENRGVAPAWNEGRRQAQGDVLAFVTSTTTVTPGWDVALTAVARTGRRIAMPYTNGKKSYEGLGITGWCWVLTRAVADEIGPFDETFVPAQYEDTDFFHRAIYVHGVELVNVPEAQVQRAGSRQSSDAAPWAARFEWLHLANRYRYAWKHGTDPRHPPPFWHTPLRDISP
jgi:GT2 family glycosyltransferase